MIVSLFSLGKFSHIKYCGSHIVLGELYPTWRTSVIQCELRYLLMLVKTLAPEQHEVSFGALPPGVQ